MTSRVGLRTWSVRGALRMSTRCSAHPQRLLTALFEYPVNHHVGLVGSGVGRADNHDTTSSTIFTTGRLPSSLKSAMPSSRVSTSASVE
jgi:hypothetical protein